MHKKVAETIKDVMGKGEQESPVKSIKLKVKFDPKKAVLEKKKKGGRE